MRKVYTLLAGLILTASVFAQAPDKMSYQAVVRDANNNLVTTQSIGIQSSILKSGVNGIAVYVETHNKSSNANGLVSLEIGTGSAQLGDFSIIDWADGPYFIKTEIDPAGGTNYTITGISQFMSVPFALYAETSGSSIPGPAGAQGSAGVDGQDGATGAQGSTGLTGTDGVDGQDGAAGLQGSAGLDGTNGVDGANGIDGSNGVDGVDGLDGAVGAQGPIGSDGANGVDGSEGIDGSNGVDGIDGQDGAVGAQGSAGLDGTNGADGLDGAVGAQGPIGSDGTNGSDGADGIDGVDGADAPVYSAGTGIDITSGVISATASGSAPEFLFVQPDAIVSGYVGFGSASAVNGIAYNSVTDEFTLKAGKTYMLDGAVYMHTTTSSNTYSFVFYDKTNNSSIGSEAYQRAADYSGTLINQPSMTAIITPVTDIQVGIKDIYGSTGGFIPSRGFFKVVELN